MITRLRNVLNRRTKEIEYFWAGHGNNPLKHLGCKDFSEKQSK